MDMDNPDKSPNESRFSRLYGLIIGINRYESEGRQDLRGCVSDAESMFEYFMDLGVPEDHLLCLFDEQATRKGILAAFESHLIKNPKIQPHDPIVIFFAGHGDRMTAPASWHTSDGKVEMILPHDASYVDSGTDNPSAQAGTRRTNTLDTDKRYIHGIPDMTLAFLLYRLSEEKGNNITVILDSCHSGSGTRGEVISRNSHDLKAPAIPDELDAQLRKSMSAAYPSELKQDITSKETSGKLMAPSLETHILLAACREDELAQEVPNFGTESGGSQCGGVFTTALLKELRRCDLETTSYTTLIRNLLAAHQEQRYKTSERVGPQTFQCEGRNQDRLLFSVQYSTSKGKIALIPTSDKSVYRVRVGSAQGIVPGTEFRVFWEKMNPTAPPVILVAKNVGSVISQLHGPNPNKPPEIPKDAYATITKYNDHSNAVRIWVHGSVKRDETWKSVLAGLDPLPISWATLPKDHDIALLPADEDVRFQGTHLIPGQFVTSHILKSSLGAKRLIEILTPLVYFYFHLKIQNKDAPVRAHLSIKLRELSERTNSWGSIIYEVKGDDLFGDSASAGTVATLQADPDKAFGLELVNNSQENLFPYVLYYDFEDYSVGALYEPPGRTVKAPLQAGKSLTIGYGSGGSHPFQVDFTTPGSGKEYGAFVLLVCSEWVDIAYLQQEPPLGGDPYDHRGERRGANKPTVWDSVVIRVEVVRPR
ncbi:hypothetical protein FRC11_002488 [Ceratobasidium sp. 423]|nr:hypothetical protein FRC11_002488 [Ceratobasidium sp. 423]